MHRFSDPLTERIAVFLREVGLEVVAHELAGDEFLPGIRIDGGRLLVDEARLLHPGDLLHEAGHVAITPAEDRPELDDDAGSDLGYEIGAIAWSYAALRHLGLDPAVVFHSEGYRGASHGFVDNFRAGRYVGVPLLQWMEMTLDEAHARERGVAPYPHMLRWLRGRARPLPAADPHRPIAPAPTRGMTDPTADDGARAPARPLLYVFQHVALRDAAFENHPELTRELEEGPDVLPLLHFRSRARLLCERAGLLADPGPDPDAVAAAEDEEDALFDAVRLHRRDRGGLVLHVVEMPAPESSPEAHFAAIVYRDGEPRHHMRPSPSTRYFTLEMADDGGRPHLCEWRRDGMHAVLGRGPEPEVDAFAEAVLARLSAEQ